jgi:hypothetical protein
VDYISIFYLLKESVNCNTSPILSIIRIGLIKY